MRPRAWTRPQLPRPYQYRDLPTLADAPARLDDRVSPTHDFASLSAGRAWQVHGKVARFRVKLISAAYPEGTWDAYECAGDDDRLFGLPLLPRLIARLMAFGIWRVQVPGSLL
jgi:hypothetical protein